MPKRSTISILEQIGQFTDEDVRSWQLATGGWSSFTSQDRADRHWLVQRLGISPGRPDWADIKLVAVEHLQDLAKDMRLKLRRKEALV